MREWLRNRFWNWDTLRIWRPEPITPRELDWITRNHFLPIMLEELNRPSPLLKLIEKRNEPK